MIEKEFKIAAVEGNSFAGKTTLANSLKGSYGFKVVEEYDKYSGGGHNFPIFPPETYGEAKKAVDFFTELEKRRSGDANDLATKTTDGVVMDRSFYSCICFQRAVSLLMPSVPNAYLYSLESFEKHVNDKNILVPPVLIYLEPQSSILFQKRVGSRGRVSIDFLNEQKTHELMRTWYYDLVKRNYTNNNGLVLTSLENQTELTVYTAKEFLLRSDYSANRVEILTRFLQNERENNA